MSFTFNKIEKFTEDLANKKHNLNGDQMVVALTNTAHTTSWNKLSDLTEIVYTTLSSRTLTFASSGQTGGVYKVTVLDLTLTSTGTSPAFRYAYIYNNTSTDKNLICYYDYGSSIVLYDGDKFTINTSQVNGLLTIA